MKHLALALALSIAAIAPAHADPEANKKVVLDFYEKGLNQKDFLNGVIGDPEYYMVCKAMFMCGGPYETTAGFADKYESDFAKAKQLLAEGGYDGTPVVLLHSTDLYVLTNMAPIAKSLMEKSGLKVDMQSMDWQTLVARRAKKDPPAQGGWNIFITTSSGISGSNPIIHTWLGAACDRGLFGWPCDPEVEKMRSAWGFAQTDAERLKIATEMQKRAIEQVVYVPFGQWASPIAYRADRLDGIIGVSGLAVLWNITKK